MRDEYSVACVVLTGLPYHYGFSFPTLKRGANNRCAYGAGADWLGLVVSQVPKAGPGAHRRLWKRLEGINQKDDRSRRFMQKVLSVMGWHLCRLLALTVPAHLIADCRNRAFQGRLNSS